MTATIRGGDHGHHHTGGDHDHRGYGWYWDHGNHGSGHGDSGYGDTVYTIDYSETIKSGHDTITIHVDETVTVDGGKGHDSISHGNGNDTVKFAGSATTAGGHYGSANESGGSSTQTGGSHSSFVTGGSSSGGTGNDTIVGGSGSGGKGSFSFDTQHSNFAQGQNTTGTSSQTSHGDSTAHGGEHSSSGGGTVYSLDDKTTVKLTGVHHS